MFKEENKYWLNSLFSDTRLLGNSDKIQLFKSKYQEEFRLRVCAYLKSGKFKDVLEVISWRDSNNIIHFFDEDFIFFFLMLNENFYLIQKHLKSLFPSCQFSDFEISKKYNFLRFIFFNLNDFNDSFVNLDFKIFKRYCIEELKIITENEINDSLNRDGRINTLENKIIEKLWKLVFQNNFRDAIELLLLFAKSFNAHYAIDRWETVYNLKSIILLNKSIDINLSATNDDTSNSVNFILTYCKDLYEVGNIFNVNIPVINFLNSNYSKGFEIKQKEFNELIQKLKKLEIINSSLKFYQLIDLLNIENSNLSKTRINKILTEKIMRGDYLDDLSWKENYNYDIFGLIIRNGYYFNLM